MPISRWNRNKVNAWFECLKLFNSMAHTQQIYGIQRHQDRRSVATREAKNVRVLISFWYFTFEGSIAISTVESIRSLLCRTAEHYAHSQSITHFRRGMCWRRRTGGGWNDAWILCAQCYYIYRVAPFNTYSNEHTGSCYFQFIRVLQGRIPSIIWWKFCSLWSLLMLLVVDCYCCATGLQGMWVSVTVPVPVCGRFE